jgi:small subunit ribosomal protein S9
MPRKKKEEVSKTKIKEKKETKSVRSASSARNDSVSGRPSDEGDETKAQQATAIPTDLQVKQGTGVKKVSRSEVLTGTGRRKTAVARVWLKREKGPTLVNDKPIEEYFPSEAAKRTYEEPLRVVNRIGQFSVTIKLEGGGTSAQLGAVVHGLARALASSDTSFREILSKKKLLTRDSRMKERRKYGHAGKARKRKQSPKR